MHLNSIDRSINQTLCTSDGKYLSGVLMVVLPAISKEANATESERARGSDLTSCCLLPESSAAARPQRASAFESAAPSASALASRFCSGLGFGCGSGSGSRQVGRTERRLESGMSGAEAAAASGSCADESGDRRALAGALTAPAPEPQIEFSLAVGGTSDGIGRDSCVSADRLLLQTMHMYSISKSQRRNFICIRK